MEGAAHRVQRGHGAGFLTEPTARALQTPATRSRKGWSVCRTGTWTESAKRCVCVCLHKSEFLQGEKMLFQE